MKTGIIYRNFFYNSLCC